MNIRIVIIYLCLIYINKKCRSIPRSENIDNNSDDDTNTTGNGLVPRLKLTSLDSSTVDNVFLKYDETVTPSSDQFNENITDITTLDTVQSTLTTDPIELATTETLYLYDSLSSADVVIQGFSKNETSEGDQLIEGTTDITTLDMNEGLTFTDDLADVMNETLLSNDTLSQNFNQRFSISPNLNVSMDSVINIYKCCEVAMFYSSWSNSCQKLKDNQHFERSISEIIENQRTPEINYITGSLNTCFNDGNVKHISINRTTHQVLYSGDIMETVSSRIFNSSEYCLEHVGITPEDYKLTMILCTIPIGSEQKQMVRKCCSEKEYYSTETRKCMFINSSTAFISSVRGIAIENNESDLTIINGTLQECPHGSNRPNISRINNEFKLSKHGDLIEKETGIVYDQSHYCLEVIGPQPNQLSLTLIFCSQTHILPKCCQHGSYFDEVGQDCFPLPSSFDDDILSHFRQDSEDPSSTYNVTPVNSFLQCDYYAFPVKEYAKNLKVSEGKLCNQITCFEEYDFCIDYIGSNDTEIKASAFICQTKYFVKCCNTDQILSKNGCVPHSNGNSVLIQHLLNTRTYVNSFDTKQCGTKNETILDNSLSEYLTWWVSSDGSYLTISADSNQIYPLKYCIDDFIGADDKVGPIAQVCASEVSDLKLSKQGSLGKCCRNKGVDGHVDYYNTRTNKCGSIPYNHSLKDNPLLKDGAFIEEHFHNFPKCSEGVVMYHTYSFNNDSDEELSISSNGLLTIVIKTGKCSPDKYIVDDRDFCIEYVSNEKDKLEVMAFVCPQVPINVFEEKYALVTALLGISCAFLLLTLVDLFRQKSRRGFVLVRKIHTFAGQMLVTFVSCQLIGFAAFTLTQYDNALNTSNSVGCHVLAGFVQFFNLATFCWNTSICLESLLLTIDISISKCVRYLLHSLWALGFPFIMTLMMFLMDAYKDDLPCWVITPNIGDKFCFLSDNAMLVYFYTPIFFTLVANISFVMIGKFLRSVRLRRLEKGTPNHGELGQKGSSGLRIHQSKNIKMESFRLVMWTGGTWFMELIGFGTRYVTSSSGQWYEYLWYIPTCVNALRGVGIFAIIVLNPVRRKEIQASISKIQLPFTKLFATNRGSDKQNDTRSSSANQDKRKYSEEQRRKISIPTLVSFISSSFYTPSGQAPNNENDSSRRSSLDNILAMKLDNPQNTSSSKRPEMAPSTSRNYCLEKLETDREYYKRKPSDPLPNLQEESICDIEDQEL